MDLSEAYRMLERKEVSRLHADQLPQDRDAAGNMCSGQSYIW